MNMSKERKPLTDKYTTLISTRIPMETANKLYKVSYQQGVNVSKIVRQTLEAGLKGS